MKIDPKYIEQQQKLFKRYAEENREKINLKRKRERKELGNQKALVNLENPKNQKNLSHNQPPPTQLKKTNKHEHPPSKKPKKETDGSNEKSMMKQNTKIVNKPYSQRNKVRLEVQDALTNIDFDDVKDAVSTNSTNIEQVDT